jgi:molybdopterin converting factor small subunit
MRAPLMVIRILINGKDISAFDGLNTQLKDANSVILMVPAAGG